MNIRTGVKASNGRKKRGEAHHLTYELVEPHVLLCLSGSARSALDCFVRVDFSCY